MSRAKPVVLVTGASGNLARAVVDALLRDADIRLTDHVPFATDLPFRRADARSLDEVREVVTDDVDILVHTAAWHGVHARTKTPVDFWQVNVDGTYNFLTAAAAASVKGVVWASSASVYGERADPYVFSKQMGESILEHFRARESMRAVAMRLWLFLPPRDFIDYGVRFLTGQGLDRRDGGSAFAAAALALWKEKELQPTYDVTSLTPFTSDEAARWQKDPWQVLEGRYTDDIESLKRHLEGRLPEQLYCGTHAHRLKQDVYEPRFNFDTFVAELRERDRAGDLSAPAGYSVA